MIEILEPYLCDQKKNSIVYPVIINGEEISFNITYKNKNLPPLNMNIDGIVIMLSSIAICNKLKITSKFPIDVALFNNLKKLPNCYKKYKVKHTSLLKDFTEENMNFVLELPTVNRRNYSSCLNTNVTPISMGIDSLHTILTNKKVLNNIIYISGLDLSNHDKNICEKIVNISKICNTPLIISISDFKQKMSKLKLNGTNYGVFTTNAIILASCYPLGINSLFFSGAGHDTFPCLSGEHFEYLQYYNSNEYTLVHNNAIRIKKINYIIQNKKELTPYIRVCNEFPTNEYSNCGKCGKCLVTMLYMFMLGNYNELSKIFPLKDDTIIKENLFSFHKVKTEYLSSIYYARIYEEILKIYIKNNKQPLQNIINKYNGKFIDDQYYLYT